MQRSKETSTLKLDKKKPAKKPQDKQLNCNTCGLYKFPLSPKMEPYGNFRKEIMLIGEAPGETEDDRGKPFQGKSGRMLGKFLKRIGVDMFEDCIIVNAIRCHPDENRTPHKKEIDCCRVLLKETINEYMPKVIIPLGGVAVQSLIGDRWKLDLGGITKWRGWTIPDQDLKCWICPTYHPSFVLRDEEDAAVDNIFQRDLENAFQHTQLPFPKNAPFEIEIIHDLSPLNDIKADLAAFDIETTGLKPHATGHRVVCASVADSPAHAYAFMIPGTRREREPFLGFLRNKAIGKMAHNIKFEDTWCRHRLRTAVENWQFDSMLAAHIIDNREGITSLKFQTYINFGIIDYASKVTPYLYGTDYKNANSHNRIYDADPDDLLFYCGCDSIYEYRLAMRQINEINYSFLPF